MAVKVHEGAGSGPPLLMLHGLGATGRAYRKLIRAMLPDVRAIVVPDHPGHGRSRPWPTEVTTPLLLDALSDLLAALDTGPLVFFGNSLGGYLALASAAAHPHHACGVFVTSPSGGVLPDAVRAEVIQRFQPQDHQQAVDLIARAMPDAGPLKRQGLAVVSRLVLRQRAVQELASSVAPSDDLTPAQMARLTMPVWVLWGTGERALEPAQREWFRDHLPAHARLREPEGWGHAAFRERPAEVTDSLRAFLATL